MVDRVGQAEIQEWFRKGEAIGVALDAEAEDAMDRARQLRRAARQVRRAMPGQRRGPGRPRKTGEAKEGV